MYSGNRHKSYNLNIIGWTVAIVLLIGFNLWFPHVTSGTETVVVNSTIVKHDGSTNDDMYLVFTDHGVFENTDSWAFFKFSSSDVQNTLMQNVGKKVDIKYYGFRIPFFSMYKNIVSATPVK